MTHKQQTFANTRELEDFVNGRAANGSLLVVSKAKLVDGNFFVLPDGTNPAVTFYYDVSGTFVPGGGYSATKIRVNVSTDTTQAQVATRTNGAINGVGAGLAVTGTVDPSNAGRVLLANDASLASGNVAITRDPSLHYEYKVTGMDGGATPIAQADIVDILPREGRWTLFYEN